MSQNKALPTFLLVTFGLAYTLQALAIAFVQEKVLFQGLLLLMMATPTLGALVARNSLSGLGWKLKLSKKGLRYYLMAWMLPASFALLGMALYFGLRPQAFDGSGQTLLNMVPKEQADKLSQSGMVLPIMLFSIVQASLLAPFINALVALGEEIGWRGYLYPLLKERLGAKKGLILGGLIWSAWHWPIITLAGYEYGTDYWGAPLLGLVVFSLFCLAAGILLDFLYQRTGSIWAPALMHGGINATTYGIYFVGIPYSHELILGPVPIGLISGLPLFLVGLYIFLKKTDQ